MPLSIDWLTKVITVPKADLLLVQASPTEIRQLDIDAFRLELKDIEDDIGMPYLDTHRHSPPVTVGGVTLARVVEIINGYTVTFEDGQYAVNLVGANSNVGDVVNVNQVSVRSANSAGLTYSKEIEDLNFFDARIHIDIEIGLPGTQYPRGTATSPVNNYADALVIQQERRLQKRFHLDGVLTLSGANLTSHNWLGNTLTFDRINFGGSTTTNASFEKLILSGVCSGTLNAYECVALDMQGFTGYLVQCGVGVLTLADGVTYVSNCESSSSGDGDSVINCAGNAVIVQVSEWSGNLRIINCTNAAAVISISSLAGKITLDATCTAGTIFVRGNAELINNANGSTVTTTGLINPDIKRTLDLTEADEVFTPTIAKKLLKGTASELLVKNVAGGNLTGTITIAE